MPDILLIQPPVRDFYLTAKRTMPYGLASVAAALRRVGFSVGLFDGLATAKSRIIEKPESMAYLDAYFGRADVSPFGLFHDFRHYGYSIEHIVAEARKSGAFLIGISSLFSAYSPTALALADALKKALPRVFIVMGGHHATALPESVMAHPAVDYVLRGDGEQSLPLLAGALRTGEPLDQVPGLVRRLGDGTPAVSPPAFMPDLGRAPVPAFDLIKWSHYRRSGRASLSLSATRGCPMRCSYCAVNAATGHPLRHRAVDAVLAELAAAHEQMPLGFVDFEDEHLGADKAWFDDLLENLTTHWRPRGVELRAMNGLYAPCLDDDLLKKMQRAGFQAVNLALITTDAAQLRRFRRPDIRPQVERVILAARRIGMSAVAYVIVGGPEQDPRQGVDDLLYLAALPVLAGVSVFYPAPGSADYQWCQDQGRLPADAELLRSTALPLAHRTDRTQAVTLLRLGRILNFCKALRDDGQPLPMPAALPGMKLDLADRMTAGKTLLAAFLKDGAVYGVEKDGRVYPHRVDFELVDRFRQGVGQIRVRGVKG